MDTAVAILERSGHAVSLFPTPGPGTAADIARQAVCSGAEFILAAGGDGTVNEIINGMVHSRVPLGILPAGTANVLATEIGLPRSLSRAARLLPECVARRIAVGCLTPGPADRFFICMTGVGFDAQIVYNIDAGLKRLLGKTAYWIGGFGQVVRRFPEFQVEIDGNERTTCSFALVSRVRNYGGDFEIARGVRLLDDRFELVLFRGRTPLPYLKYVLGMTLGRLAGMRGVSFHQARCVRIFDPDDRRIYVQVDGENAGSLPVHVSLVPDALTLLIPPPYLNRL